MVHTGKQVVLADLRRENADAAAEVMRDAGFDVHTATVDVSSRESVHTLVQTATTLGDVTGVIHAAGVSPSHASPATILAVDLYGTALVLSSIASVGSILAPPTENGRTTIRTTPAFSTDYAYAAKGSQPVAIGRKSDCTANPLAKATIALRRVMKPCRPVTR